MTLLQAKEKALNLLSETLTTSGASEYLPKFNSFFDTAQKEIAGIKPIIKTALVTSVNCLITKPTDARKIIALMTPDYEVLSMVWVGNNLLVTVDDDYLIEYEAYPTEILSNTLDTYEFEIAKETQEAIPFYGAAMCVQDENPPLYSELMAMYNGKLSNIENSIRIRFVGGRNV